MALCLTRVAEVHNYIVDCCYDFAVAPSSADESAPQKTIENEDDAYDVYSPGCVTDIVSSYY